MNERISRAVLQKLIRHDVFILPHALQKGCRFNLPTHAWHHTACCKDLEVRPKYFTSRAFNFGFCFSLAKTCFLIAIASPGPAPDCTRYVCSIRKSLWEASNCIRYCVTIAVMVAM